MVPSSFKTIWRCNKFTPGKKSEAFIVKVISLILLRVVVFIVTVISLILLRAVVFIVTVISLTLQRAAVFVLFLFH